MTVWSSKEEGTIKESKPFLRERRDVSVGRGIELNGKHRTSVSKGRGIKWYIVDGRVGTAVEIK